MPIPRARQLDLSKDERERLGRLVETDWTQDSMDFEKRNEKLRRLYRLWRNSTDINAIPDQERSNFSIPLVLWMILAKLSKELDVLLGEESEIVVNPIGKSDVDRVPKVKKWMNWRVKHSLKLFRQLYDYLLQKAVFGTSIGFLGWKTKTRTVRVEEQVEGDDFTQEVEKEVVDFDGPEFIVENLEDWVVPVDASSIEDASHYIRRLRLTFDEILDMADEGQLDEKLVKEHKEQLKHFAFRANTSLTQDTASTDRVTEEKRDSEGLPDKQQGREEKLTIYNWFGRFRRMVKVNGVEEPEDRSEEVVVYYSPDVRSVLGVSRLVDIFPDGRRPHIKSNGVQDINRFWGIGLCEMLEPIQREMDAFHNLAISAGEGAIGPVIFGTPAAGQALTARKLEPYTFVPVADPNSIKSVNLGDINLQPYVVLIQQMEGFAERLTALTDPQLGRQFDQPNAPRTFGQQALLQAESNVRLLLDIRLERENLRELLRRIWELDKRYLPDETFFRVTEEDPGDVLTKEDMQGSFDFDIGPVTAISNRTQKMQETMQALSLVLPLGMPQISVALLKKVLEKLGHPDVAALLPDLGQLRPPRTPDEENVRILQGEDVDPHPLDNHAQHIAKHQDFRQRAELVEPFPAMLPGVTLATQNPGLLGRIDAHIAEHQQAASQQAGLSLVQAQTGQPGQQPVTPAPGQQSPVEPETSPQSPVGTAQSQLASLLNTGGTNIA